MFSPVVERALRVAAAAHHRQHRKGTVIPYITHPAAVALILLQGGFGDEHVLAAALLHDVVEDTEYSLAQLQTEFPSPIPEFVAALSERKLDETGARRPWRERKEEHLAHLAGAPIEVRAIALADKLHNLTTIVFDLESGADVWSRFNAPRDQLLWYHRSMIEQAGSGDPRLVLLKDRCAAIIDRLG